MLNLVSLLTAAALASLQCGLQTYALLEHPKLDVDNSIQSSIPAVHSPRRKLNNRVHINEAPPEVVQQVPGEPLVLKCQVSGSPNPSVTWLKNGEPVDFDAEMSEILPPYPDSFATLDSKLVVTAPSNGDVYTCAATSELKQDTASTTVYSVDDSSNVLLEKLLRLPSKPVITASYSEVLQDIGTNLVLPCKVHSFSKYHVEWEDSDEQSVYGNPRFRVLPTGDLFILGLKWADMGHFVCRVKNAHGQDEATTFVYPSKPT